jgi:crotonobetainyl-CoA:carnitine CoA-transferase CaiB-like acyl-CoA transferase
MGNPLGGGMPRPLEGIKVVEVAMWAFVPAAGGILSDLGATVIKVEPPSGDPIRGLEIGAFSSGPGKFDFSWENYNRGKRSITLDLHQDLGVEVLYKLLQDADVFLTNLLPRARSRMKIDIDAVRAQFPNIIYAVGSGAGRLGPESHRGGFDAATFWARGGVSSSLTEDGAERPVGPPGPAFGDCISASILAGGIAAAIAQRAMTGHASIVDVSLLSSAMWCMQRGITQSTYDGIERFPRPTGLPNNPLVNTYETSDGRFVSMCMLQQQRYWAEFCKVAGKPELAGDPRFVDTAARKANMAACVAELQALFRSKTLVQWRAVLSRQEGQWDVVQHVGELSKDLQVQANQYMQTVHHDDGRQLQMVSIPMQFDGAPLPAGPAPQLGADSDALLGDLGYDIDQIMALKVAGVVF